MKKLLFTITLTLVAFTTNAQSTVKGDMNDDGILTIVDVMLLINTIIGNTPEPNNLTCPDNNHPHAIDLGLPSGTKWACCNVGAAVPEAYGGYYAWGETEEKDIYNINSYIYCEGSKETYYDLGYSICGTEYDVAHVKWGASWQMPSLNQIQEFVEYCTYEWTTLNGINGKKFISKNNDKRIFLPAAGNRYSSQVNNRHKEGNYWSGMEVPDGSHRAYKLYFDNEVEGCYYNYYRYFGCSIRPVWVEE